MQFVSIPCFLLFKPKSIEYRVCQERFLCIKKSRKNSSKVKITLKLFINIIFIII